MSQDSTGYQKAEFGSDTRFEHNVVPIISLIRVKQYIHAAEQVPIDNYAKDSGPRRWDFYAVFTMVLCAFELQEKLITLISGLF